MGGARIRTTSHRQDGSEATHIPYRREGPIEGIGSLNFDLDGQISSSSFHYTPWALHSDLVH